MQAGFLDLDLIERPTKVWLQREVDKISKISTSSKELNYMEWQLISLPFFMPSHVDKDYFSEIGTKFDYS